MREGRQQRREKGVLLRGGEVIATEFGRSAALIAKDGAKAIIAVALVGNSGGREYSQEN